MPTTLPERKVKRKREVDLFLSADKKEYVKVVYTPKGDDETQIDIYTNTKNQALLDDIKADVEENNGTMSEIHGLPAKWDNFLHRYIKR